MNDQALTSKEVLPYSKGLTLLYVEDDQGMLENGLALFQNFFAEVASAKNGQEAWNLLQERSFDLIVTDIRMPKMDGVELSRLIKERDFEQPIMVISAHDDSYYLQDLLNIGVDYFLAKPIDLQRLVPTLYKVCRNVHLKIQDREAEKKLIEYNEKLQRLNSDKDKFLSIISHDLKGPFNGIMGLSAILADTVEQMSLEDIKEASEGLHSASKRYFKLLENLLEWALLQMGRMKKEPKPILAPFIVNEVLDINRDRAEQKGVDLSAKIEGTPHYLADLSMLRSILHNLVSNAVKFTPEGGSVTVTVSEAEPGWLLTEVKDTGTGMPDSIKEKLFRLDEHVTTEGTEQESGTGLGLLLCMEMVEKHEGRIWVESEEGRGSSFFFTLPARPPQEA